MTEDNMLKLAANEQEICKGYLSGLSSGQLAKKYNSNDQGVLRLLTRCGIQRRSNSDAARKYSVDISFFDNIDNEVKAYILGLIYADGNIYKARLALALHKKDRAILERIKSEIKYDGLLLEQHGLLCLSICNKHITEELIKKGVFPAKSLILKFPTSDVVPSDLLWHFVRGYFDGDGGFCADNRSKNIHYSVEIQGTQEFCGSLDQLIFDRLGFRSAIRLRSNVVSSALKFYQDERVVRFCELVYQDATIYLDRKYKIYESLKQRILR